MQVCGVCGVWCVMCWGIAEEIGGKSHKNKITYISLSLSLSSRSHACTHTRTQLLMFMCGAQIGFFRGDVKELVKDIQELKPTIFVSVPRLLNRIYDKV